MVLLDDVYYTPCGYILYANVFIKQTNNNNINMKFTKSTNCFDLVKILNSTHSHTRVHKLINMHRHIHPLYTIQFINFHLFYPVLRWHETITTEQWSHRTLWPNPWPDFSQNYFIQMKCSIIMVLKFNSHIGNFCAQTHHLATCNSIHNK